MKFFINKSISAVFCALLLSAAATVLLLSTVFSARTIELELETLLPCENVEVRYPENNFSSWQKRTFANFSGVYKAKLNAGRLSVVRLDFNADKNDLISLKNIKLQGRNKKNIYQLAVVNTENCTVNRSNPTEIIIRASEKNPNITLQSDTPLKGSLHIDFIWSGVIFSLCFMIFCILIKSAEPLIKKDSSNTADLIFIAIFTIIIIIPASKINLAEISETENRSLARLPHFISRADGTVNSRFGVDFDKYFSDRFCCRTFIINQYKQLKTLINSDSRYFRNKNIIGGKDKWFFLRLKNKYNTPHACPFDAKEMRDHLASLKKFNEWCKKHNIRFYYFIAPDKRQVYNDKYSYTFYEDSPTDISIWVDYVKKHSDINVIYPLDTLRKNKSNNILYYKNDTHWNYLGAYYGYSELIKYIRKDFPLLQHWTAEKFTEEKHNNGDLVRLAPEVSMQDDENHKKPVLPDDKKLYSRTEKSYDISYPHGKYNALILRDSFSAAMLDYCFLTFKNTRAYWRYSLLQKEFDHFSNGKNRPDIIILEHVERFAEPALQNFAQGILFVE